MRIKHRFVFDSRNNNFDIVALLTQKNIAYDYSEESTIFEVFEDDKNFETIVKSLEPYGVFRNSPEAIYTKAEIKDAQWLTVRSNWHNLYPQPEDDMRYRFTTYDATDTCAGRNSKCFCRNGLTQKESFVLKKEPRWGSRNFMMLNWVFDELFVSKKAEEVLTTSGLAGFEIYDVLSKSKRPLKEVKQVFVKTYLPQGFSVDSIEETYICPTCKLETYWPKAGSIHFHKEIFKDIVVDIAKTSDKFWATNCASLILITHKFYKAITEAKLDRGLVFEPVKLV